MNKIDARLAKMSENLAALSEKAAKASEEAKVVRELREEAINDQICTVKGDIAAFEENVRLSGEESKSRLRSALLKIKMTIESKIRERREFKDKVLMQLYVADQLDYIDECFAGAAYLVPTPSSPCMRQWRRSRSTRPNTARWAKPTPRLRPEFF